MANRPPIKLPFRKVENCNQVLKIGKELKFSLVNIAGNDIVQGNKKLILGKWYFNQLRRACILGTYYPVKDYKPYVLSDFSINLS